VLGRLWWSAAVDVSERPFFQGTRETPRMVSSPVATQGSRNGGNMKADELTKLLLAIIAAFLGTLVVRPVFHPDRVRAGSAEIHPFFVEPG
jgi:hypothetical protein